MNHADTLRGIASRAEPFLTVNAGKQDLIDAAAYIDTLENKVLRLMDQVSNLEQYAPKAVETKEA